MLAHILNDDLCVAGAQREAEKRKRERGNTRNDPHPL